MKITFKNYDSFRFSTIFIIDLTTFRCRYATASARSDGMFLLCGGRDASGAVWWIYFHGQIKQPIAISVIISVSQGCRKKKIGFPFSQRN